MTPATAGLFLALSFGADEFGTQRMQAAGGQDINPSFKSRMAWKGAITPVYLGIVKGTEDKPWPHKPRRKVVRIIHKVVKYGVPAGFFGAGIWDLHVAQQRGNR